MNWIGVEHKAFITTTYKNDTRRDFTIPFGPKVVFTKSAIAMAPTKEACTKKNHTTHVMRVNQLFLDP